LGLTALAGSLVAISAQAGEISVSGAANITYKTAGGSAVNGPAAIGTDKDVAFSGGGELDNGYTFNVTTTLTDAMTVSSSFTSITMGSLGTLTVNGISTGGSAGKYDEEVPQAYEQISDGVNVSANDTGNQLDSSSLTYNSPVYDMGGASVSFDIDYAPQADDGGVNDGGLSAANETRGKGYGLGLTVGYEGLKVGAYGAEMENKLNASTGATDGFEGVWYANYTYGPVSFGYSESYLDAGASVAAEAITAIKATRTAGGIFESDTMSIAYNVNDDLSVSYTIADDTYDAQTGGGSGAANAVNIADVTQKSKAMQIAYSMGAMSIKAYKVEVDNPGYSSTAQDASVTELAIGLAF
jgi:outer membrane protein OmpU